MLKFTTINVDGKKIDWKFSSVEELRTEWNKDDCDLPSGDDAVVSCVINGARFNPSTFEEIVALLNL